ncbi:MAG: hypothetical protein J1F37_07940 [Oscillospiraceae bacterium]|nr:hypothetical protein [Oscillospiraceae bacterium]
MKISQLPQAAAVSNDDLLPIVQNGETKKVDRKTLVGDVPDDVSITDGKLQLTAKGEPVGVGVDLPAPTVDQTVTENSKNAVSGGAVKTYVDGKSDELKETFEKSITEEIIARKNADNSLQEKVTNAANAVKGTAKGDVLFIDDVSPIEQAMDITLSSKNMFNYGWDFKSIGSRITVEKEENAITFIWVSTDRPYFSLKDESHKSFNFKPNTTYTSKATVTLTELSGSETASDGAGSAALTLYLADNANFSSNLNPKIAIVNGYIKETNNGKRPGTYEITTTFTTPDDLSPYQYLNTRLANNTSVRYENIMICEGTEPQDYVPYADVSNVEVMRTGHDSSNPEAENVQTAISDENGIVKDLTSFYPEMSIAAKTPNIVLHCEYNKDLNKVIEQLTQAILSLGGNV